MEKKMRVELQKPYAFIDIIRFAYDEDFSKIDESFFEGKLLFSKSEIANESAYLEKNTIVYVDTLVFENNENDEYYSNFVVDNDLNIICLGEILVDVIGSYKDYKDELNIGLVLKALEYYLDNDTFMELD